MSSSSSSSAGNWGWNVTSAAPLPVNWRPTRRQPGSRGPGGPLPVFATTAEDRWRPVSGDRSHGRRSGRNRATSSTARHGIAGLAGIPRVRSLGPAVSLLRPLLDFRRAEIEAYLAKLGQSFCTDSSNASRELTRNRLRHDLLPRLAADYNPAIVEALTRLSKVAGDTQRAIEWQPSGAGCGTRFGQRDGDRDGCSPVDRSTAAFRTGDLCAALATARLAAAGNGL